MPNCKKCDASFPNRVRIDGAVRVINKRKYCFECSPYGSKNTRDLTKPDPNKIKYKVCCRCEIKKHRSQYYRRGEPGRENQLHGMCKDCANSQNREVKKWAVEYKGGKCVDCGYNKCISALEFHHLDPTKKDFIISRHRSLRDAKSFEALKRELDKCAIVCSNCHRERHARERGHL